MNVFANISHHFSVNHPKGSLEPFEAFYLQLLEGWLMVQWLGGLVRGLASVFLEVPSEVRAHWPGLLHWLSWLRRAWLLGKDLVVTLFKLKRETVSAENWASEAGTRTEQAENELKDVTGSVTTWAKKVEEEEAENAKEPPFFSYKAQLGMLAFLMLAEYAILAEAFEEMVGFKQETALLLALTIPGLLKLYGYLIGRLAQKKLWWQTGAIGVLAIALTVSVVVIREDILLVKEDRAAADRIERINAARGQLSQALNTPATNPTAQTVTTPTQADTTSAQTSTSLQAPKVRKMSQWPPAVLFTVLSISAVLLGILDGVQHKDTPAAKQFRQVRSRLIVAQKRAQSARKERDKANERLKQLKLEVEAKEELTRLRASQVQLEYSTIASAAEAARISALSAARLAAEPKQAKPDAAQPADAGIAQAQRAQLEAAASWQQPTDLELPKVLNNLLDSKREGKQP